MGFILVHEPWYNLLIERRIMEIELLVQIGILFCLLYIIWFLRAFDVVNTKFWNTHYRLLEEIRDKD